MVGEKYAVFLDIDDTLLDRGILPQVNIDAIRRVRSQGHYVLVNTGRAYGAIDDLLLKSNLFDGFVTGLGTDIRLHGEQVYHDWIPNRDLVSVAQLLMKDQRQLFFEAEAGVLVTVYEPDSMYINLIQSPDDLLSRYAHHKIAKLCVPGQLADLEMEILSKQYTVLQHKHYAEIVKKGHGKAFGLLYVAQYLGIPSARCIAMGDSLNDMDMLEAAGISVAMANAVPEVKSICTYITCSAKDGGVAQALDELIPPVQK